MRHLVRVGVVNRQMLFKSKWWGSLLLTMAVPQALCEDMKGRADFFDALDIDAVGFDQLKRRLSIDTPEQWVTELQRLTHFKPVSFFFQALCAAKGVTSTTRVQRVITSQDCFNCLHACDRPYDTLVQRMVVLP